MAADAELGVLLEPTNDLQDEVDDVSVGVNGQGGDLSAGQAQQQESILAGGVSKGLAAAGVIAGILTQLKSVGALLGSIAGFLSRSLLPAIEVIADLIRPLISGINDFIADPVGSLGGQENVQTATQAAQASAPFLPGLNFAEGARRTQETFTNDQGGVATPDQLVGNIADQLFNLNPADRTGEANKNRLNQLVQSALRDKTGGG